jgi:glycerol transport system substrate-binding protein
VNKILGFILISVGIIFCLTLHSNDIVEKWTEIFQPSVFSREERYKELKWFHDTAGELRGMKIRSAAENIETHYWESRVLAIAFRELTGIEVDHRIMPENRVVDSIIKQIQNNVRLYDIYVNDSDLIGTHLRTGGVVDLGSYMKGKWSVYTNPFLQLHDFLNLEFGQDYDGKLLQLPDQHFANLYWFRYDWFARKDFKTAFKKRYGYELGVPRNWAAYEDIAEFFNTTLVDGKRVYGHCDYGSPSPSLGWRFTDSWLSIAGVGDAGLPNGLPVDEWGIRVKDRIPRGSSVSRGGALNGPAARYALETYIRWLKTYSPPETINMQWHEAGTRCANGDIAQRIFQYVTWLSDKSFHIPSSPVCDSRGKPLWRVAPTPCGQYWQQGMKIGYQDAGSWTIPQNVTGKKRAAAWLWAQFCVSKTVSLKKFIIGGTPVRRSTVFSQYLTEHKDEYGGLVEFYRSPQQKLWTASGRNVPSYASMSRLWWTYLSQAIRGEVSAQQALDRLAAAQDRLMAGLSLKRYSPRLNPQRSADYWLNQPGAPKPEKTGRQKPETISYDALLKRWKEQ